MKDRGATQAARPPSDRGPLGFRSVAARILFTYFVVLATLVTAAVINISAFRRATEDAELLRTGLVPLALRVGALKSAHDGYAAQLSTLEAPGSENFERTLDKLRNSGRNAELRAVRRALREAIALSPDLELDDLEGRVREIEGDLRRDEATLTELGSLRARSDLRRFGELRARLDQRSGRVQRGTARFERDVAALLRALSNAAKARESIALVLLVVLGGVTLLVGVLMALFANRVVSPISFVTKRAQAVAQGRLDVEPALASNDEIGELSRTFEAMVVALVEGRERLLQSERLAAIGKMAAHATHEIRNPLNSIALNLELLEDELPAESDEARSLLAAIVAEVDRLGVLSSQYLSMARHRAPEFSVVGLEDVLDGIARFVRPEFDAAGVRFETSLSADLPLVELDGAQFRQAVLNLLRNAREATPAGGLVRLVARSTEVGVRIDVEDDGPGVPEAEVERLFDPFFTTKEHGTGLGLAVTDQILRAHRARLWYESPAKGGSRFSLEVPRAAEERG